MTAPLDKAAFIGTIAAHFDLDASELEPGAQFGGDGFDSLMLFELFDLFEELVGRPVEPGALEEVHGLDALFMMYTDLSDTANGV